MEKIQEYITKTENDTQTDDKIWRQLQQKYPETTPEDFLFLKKNVLSDGDWDTLSEASIKIKEKISKDFKEKGESGIVDPLIEYINNVPVSVTRNELYFYVKSIASSYDYLKYNYEGKIKNVDTIAVKMSNILNKEEIWYDTDRSNRGKIINLIALINLDNLSEDQKEIISRNIDNFIGNLKTSRTNSRESCKSDIESALKIIKCISPHRFSIDYKNIEPSTDDLAEKILKSTGDRGWPEPERYFKIENWTLNEDEDENLLREGKYSLEQITSNTQKAIELTEQIPDLPETIKPAIQLFFFNNLNAFDPQLSEEESNTMNHRTLEKYKQYIVLEKKAEEDPLLPTIGVEIEVPYDFPVDEKYFSATEYFDIPNGYDEAWEFACKYSYSASTQNLLVHELIRGGFIETEEQQERKKIRGSGDFSLHVNLGLPLELTAYLNNPKNITKDQANKEYGDRADRLVNALTYGFSSQKRLDKRKTKTRMKLTNDAEKSKKRSSATAEEQREQWSRLEIRSLELRDLTFYRMLKEAQLLAAALFSRSLEVGGKEETGLSRAWKLSKAWNDFESKVDEILSQHNLKLDSLDDDIRWGKVLEQTNIQKEMRNLITDTSKLIQNIIIKTDLREYNKAI